jgi:hypothetical protein
LMGSILSFPILCLANATILAWSYEVGNNCCRYLKDIPICVNGDDGLVKASPLTKECWELISAYFGLSPSQGKVFYSSEFLDINSTNFTVSQLGFYSKLPVPGSLEFTKGRTIHFQRTPYVNFGLLYQMKRSESTKTDSQHLVCNYNSMGSQLVELLETAPSFLTLVIYQKFIDLHYKKISDCGIPWYLPQNLGGLGFPIIEGTKFVPSLKDCSLVHRYLMEPGNYVLPPKNQLPWKLWQIVAKRIETLQIPSSSRFSDLSSGGVICDEDTLIGLLCVESLFCSSGDALYVYPCEEKQIYDPAKSFRRFWQQILAGKGRLKKSPSLLPPPLLISNFPKNFPNRKFLYYSMNELSKLPEDESDSNVEFKTLHYSPIL